jgi:hypothetical protein
MSVRIPVVALSTVFLLLAMSVPRADAAGSLIISEFRLRGPNGAQDEFIEIYNDSASPHTVAALSRSGYAIAASDGVVRCSIPNGTVIPARGYWLCANSVGYSLTFYPSGSGNTTGDGTYTTDIADNAGIALFNNNTGGGSFSLANRFDAVGSTSEANALYREGAGYPALLVSSTQYAWVRDECGKGGAVNLLGACTISTPKDTDNNVVDFYFVDASGASLGGGQRLGAPAPQNLGSPIQRNGAFAVMLLDSTVSASAAPNRVRDLTSDPPNNSTAGTLTIRRRLVNTSGAPVTRLRFRVIDLDTFPAAAGFADLRVRSSVPNVVPGINDAATCLSAGSPSTPPCSVTVWGTGLEQPPSQGNGGAFNSGLNFGVISLGSPLAPGASIAVEFRLGVQQTGSFRFYVNLEALP